MTAGEGPSPLTIDQRYSLLSSRYRRYALYYLTRHETPATLPEIADYVTELEHGVPADEIPDERLQVYSRLYHTHVPRLANADVVVYDQENDAVELGPNFPDLEPELRRTMREESPGDCEEPVTDDQ